MNIIKGILGEADADVESSGREVADPKPKPEEEANGDETPPVPQDSEIDELANLWAQGNHSDVAERFLAMDNETAVKMVFAIGRDGALELARMVDGILEQRGDEEGRQLNLGGVEDLPGEDAPTTEPASVEPPRDDSGYPTRQILGVQ